MSHPPPPAGALASPDVVGKIARARTAARAEIQAFLGVYDGSRSAPPICAALVRAWHALASLDILLQGAAPPGAAAFVESLAREGSPLPVALGDVSPAFAAKVAACATSEPWSLAAGPSDREFDQHRRVLLRAARTLAKRVRRVPGLGIHWRRVGWTTAAAVAVALSATAIAFAFYKPRWRVSYYANASLFGAPSLVVRTMDPDQDWGPGGPGSGVPTDHFSARVESCLRLDKPEVVTFVAGSDDGSRLYVDDHLLIDAWVDQEYRTREEPMPLAAGLHAIRFEYYERSGNARLSITGRIGGSSAEFDSRLRMPADGAPVCR